MDVKTGMWVMYIPPNGETEIVPSDQDRFMQILEIKKAASVLASKNFVERFSAANY
ncbi:hypothetical protein D3C73_1667290 [compost metagenome]